MVVVAIIVVLGGIAVVAYTSFSDRGNEARISADIRAIDTAVGGIKEVVVAGKTGLLVPFEPRSPTDFEPKDADRFARTTFDVAVQA